MFMRICGVYEDAKISQYGRHFTDVFKHDINMFFCYVRMYFYELLAVITAEKRIKKWLIIKNLTINKNQIVGII